MGDTRVYSYSKKSRWRNIGRVALFCLAPVFLFYVFTLLWANFLFLDLSWEELFSRFRLFIILFAIGGGIGAVLGDLLRQSLKFKLDETSIGTDGWGQTKVIIPYSEITEIKKSRFDVVQIKSKHLNRTIVLAASNFEPEDYAEIEATLEQWKAITSFTKNELLRPWIAFGVLILFGLLLPIFYSSQTPIIRAAPYLAWFVFMIVMIILMRKRQEGPVSRLVKFSPYFFAVMALILAGLTYFSEY